MAKKTKPSLITIPQAADELGLVYQTVYHHVIKLDLGTKYGGTLLLDKDDMKALRERETVPGRKKAHRDED